MLVGAPRQSRPGGTSSKSSSFSTSTARSRRVNHRSGSDVAALLHDFLGVMKVAVISGGDWTQFQKQLLANLPDDERLKDLYLLPTCGTQFYEYVGHWSKVYSEDLSDEERTRIKKALQDAYDQSGTKVDQTWGEVIEDRGSQITMLGPRPRGPARPKRRSGTLTSPSARRSSRSSSRCCRSSPSTWVGRPRSTSPSRASTRPTASPSSATNCASRCQEMLFAGDAIFPGGNDYPAQEAGVDSILVRDPWETARVIQTVIACLAMKRQITSPGKQS